MSALVEALEVERAMRGSTRRGVTRPAEEAEGEGEGAPRGGGEGRQRWVLRLEDGREAVIDRRLTLGCAPDNGLVLDDPFVSGWHCVVRRMGSRVVVVDCGSRNGTFLGGVRVASGELRPGMRLTVGRTALRMVVEGPAIDPGLIGRSAGMRKLKQQILTVAPTRANVLLLGESGTGKELAARALHDQSGRTGAFVVLNCGAISPELVESELFGHEKGAFTGATARRSGVFVEADGGTLFLDEIGELPIGLQSKLLRALEERSVRAVGASGERRVDVRVVAATHRDLRTAVQERAFRLDLFHRLSTVVLDLPSLRERGEDVPILARYFLDQMAAESGDKVFSPSAMEALATYGWPGNVRELRNAVQRAAIFGGAVIQPADLLPASVCGEMAGGEAVAIAGRRLDEVEREVIAAALRRTAGNKRAAASALGMAKSTLCDKVRRYRIEARG
ncbi:MAG: FHA domain-containing protein [Myxococcales bacterium]|nr:FHA domain-containing protein [Myxococcales bacterium]